MTLTLIPAIAVGLLTGIVFGFALEKSRVFEPGIIVGQMQLRSFIMLKVFLAAVITGLIVLAVLNGFYGVPLHLKPLVWKADIIGGLLLGAGIALAGACPGTALAQIGAGYRDAWYVLIGGIAGAIAYGYLDQRITTLFADSSQPLTLDGLVHLPFWQTALFAALGLAVLLAGLELATPWRAEIGDDVDGVLPEEDGHHVPGRIAGGH